jgi:signal transduction histidine kinase/CheY-like chemotaxis protein/HPt (histidine-containing phosphotransfer) domain-containing protein
MAARAQLLLSGTALLLGLVALVLVHRRDASAAEIVLLALAATLLGSALLQGARILLPRWSEDAARRARSPAVVLAEMGPAIRTPMNGIIGMTDLALDGPLAHEQRSSLENVRSSAESLLATLSNLLDYAKMETGRLELAASPFELRNAIYAAIRSVAGRAHAKALELVWQIDPDVPDVVVGDAKRLQQILYNLLDNAVRFTPAGEVVVRVQREAIGDGEIVLAFEVEDTGIGVDERTGQRLFDGRGAAGRVAEPSGLGLAVAAALAERMGGRIEVRSTPGCGSTFRFRIRVGVERERRQRLSSYTSGELRDVRILVLDDNASSRRGLTGALRTFRAVPTGVETVPAALAALRDARAAGQPFALVVIDLEIRGGSGFDLAARIGSDGALGRPAVVGTTSLGAPAGEHSAVPLRVPKPFRTHELLRAAQQAVAQLALARLERPAAPAANGRLRSLRVLLAEDNRIDRTLAAHLLEKRGHAVTAVETGAQAVAALAHESFDVVFMDVQMPEMDGLQATHEIRRREQRTGARVPIVALTAHDTRTRCLEAGMDAYVTKPVDAEEIAEILDQLVIREAGSARTEEASEEAARPLDEMAALERAGGDHALLVDLAGMCLSDGLTALERIREGLVGKDSKAIERAAHKLKGSLLVLAADPASEAAYRLEALGAQGALDQAADALAALERELERLRPALARIVGAR